MEWMDVCGVVAERRGGRTRESRQSGLADIVLRGAVLFDDRPEPEEAEKVAGDAGTVEVGRPGNNQWRSSRDRPDCEGRCCGAARPARRREAGVRQERDCRGHYRRTGRLKRRISDSQLCEFRCRQVEIEPLTTDKEETGMMAAGAKL